MKKNFLFSIIVLVLLLTGCTQKISNVNINNLNQSKEKHSTVANTNQSDNSTTASTTKIVSSCKLTNKCSGDTKIYCLKSWLETTNCFDKNYVTEHFSNFLEKPGENNLDRVFFDFKMSSNLILSAGELNYTGYAIIIEVGPKDYRVLSYVGPLKKYQLNISKEDALKKAKNDNFCKISEQANILNFVNLNVRDEFSSYYYIKEGKFYGYDSENQFRFKFDSQNLYWNILTTTCEKLCFINAQTGDLIKKEISCDYK